MLDGAHVYLSQSWLSFKALYGWLRLETYLLVKILDPILKIVFFSLIARFALGTQDVSYYVIGNAIHTCYTSALFGAAVMLRSERNFGTLMQVIGSPANKFYIYSGRSLFYFLDGVANVTIALIGGALIFGLDFAHANLSALLLAIMTGVLAATAGGLFLGSFGLILTDVNLVLNVASCMLLAFTGTNFPVDSLPQSLQWIAQCLPLTRSLTAARMAYAGASIPQILPPLAGELGLAVGFLLMGFWLFHALEVRARVKGNLDLS